MAQARYRIVDLRPGVYTVTFTLTGFSTVKREGIELTTAFTANVNAEMKVGTVQETVTVTGESPIVDVQNVVTKSTATREVMDAIPTDRNFVSFAALTPAVLVTGVRQNVGGSIPETGMNLVVHGSRAGDSLVMVDGMPIINGSGAGGLQYGNYLNNAMAQEITFQTDAQSAPSSSGRRSTRTSSRRKGRTCSTGFFSGRFTNDSLESDNLDATYIAQGLKSGSKVNKIWDANPAGGGPIIKDKMWIYAGYRHWGTYNTVAGSFKDADFTEFPYYSCKPDRKRRLHDRAEPVPGVALGGGCASDDPARVQEQDQPVLRPAVHLLRQLLRADAGDGDQRLPRVQEHPAVHRAGQLELAGHQQAAARGRRAR